MFGIYNVKKEQMWEHTKFIPKNRRKKMKEYICESEDIKIRKLQDTDEELTMLGKWRDDERVSRFYGGRDKDNSL